MLKFIFKDKKNVGVLGIILILTCVQVVFEFLIPTFMGFIIEIVNDPNRQKYLSDIVMCSAFIVLSAVGFILVNIVISYLSSRATANSLANIRHKLHAKIFSLSLAEINRYGVGALITRTTNDIAFIGNILVTALHNIMHGPILVIGALTFLIVEGCYYELLLIIVAAVLLLSILVFIGSKMVIPKFETIEKKTDDFNAINKEGIEGLRVVRAFNAERFLENKFTKVNFEYSKTDCSVNRILGSLTPLLQYVLSLVTVSIVTVSAFLIKNPDKDLRYDQMAVIIQFGTLLLSGLITVAILLAYFPRVKICMRRINEILDLESSIKDSTKSVDPIKKGSIEFKNVSFSYPNGKVNSLENINFKVKPGETVAFVGPTGSGKTSLINLLLHFFEPQKGEIFVNGHDIKLYPRRELYKIISWVPQKSYLFHDTIKNNVCIGNPKASKEKINKVLNICQARNFVNNKIGKLNYVISSGGKNVSGGQRQRLCIARALICDPQILILDDSFSSLDFKTVKLINTSLKKEFSNITNVIVSQRISAIMHADLIIVLDNGKIIGTGKHKELLKKCEVYRDFATAQLGEKELSL